MDVPAAVSREAGAAVEGGGGLRVREVSKSSGSSSMRDMAGMFWRLQYLMYSKSIFYLVGKIEADDVAMIDNRLR